MTPDPFDFEAGWRRRERFRAIERGALLRMLAPAVHASQVEAIEPLAGGKANTNYRVRLQDGRGAVLRIYTRDSTACAREAALHALVASRVPVARVLYAEPDPAVAGNAYALLEWLDGESLAQAWASGEEQRALGRTLGETLAAIGSYRFGAPGFFDAGLSRSGAGEPDLLGYLESCLDDPASTLDNPGGNLGARVRELVNRHQRLLSGTGPPVLVHGDYKAGNILVRRIGDGWQVSGVLDWEFAFAGPRLYDLAPLLRFSHRLPPGFEPGVIDGLREGGVLLPADWQQRVRLLDFANLCDFARQPGRGDRMAADVRSLIERTLREWDSYAGGTA